MKATIKTYFSRLAGGILICAAAFTFIACENFLTGDEIKDQIESEIAYNNAKDVNIFISCKEEIGSVFPQQSYKAKIGYEFEIQFVLNDKNYIIKNPATIFEAVSRIKPEESRSDCVVFKVVEQSFQDKQNGLYRVKVKVIKNVDDIMIQPACIAYPAIKSTSPEFSATGHYANTPIVITFNQSLESDDGEINFFYGNDCISVSSHDEDMSTFFDKPALRSDKTELYLYPKGKELSDFIKNKGVDYIDIKVSFSSKIKIVKNDIELFFVQNENSNFTVRYMDKIERFAPKLISDSLIATRKSVSLSEMSNLAVEDTAVIKSLGSFTDDTEYLRNRIKDNLYIAGKCYDEESGIKTIEVSAKLTHDCYGRSVTTAPKIFKFSVTDNNSNAEFVSDDEGIVSYLVKLQDLNVFENGALEISIKAIDYCNNISEGKSFHVFLKSFGNDVFKNIEVGNAYPFKEWFKSNMSAHIYNEEDYKDMLRTIYCEDKITQFLFYYDGRLINLPDDSYSYKCIVTEKNGSKKEYIFDKEPNYSTGVLMATKKIDAQSISGLKLTVYISDDMGNHAEKAFKLPDNDKVSVVTGTGGGQYYTRTELLYSYSEDEDFIPLSYPVLWISEKENDHKLYAYAHTTETDLSRESHKLIFHWGDSINPIAYSNGTKRYQSFFSEVSDDDIVIPIVDSNIKYVNGNYAVEKAEEEGWLNITVTATSGQTFDSYYVAYPVVDKESSKRVGEWKSDYFQPGTLSHTFKTSTRYYLSTNLEFYLYGIKDGIRSSYKVFTINYPKIEYDNYKPWYEVERSNYGYYSFYAKDIGSGPKGGYVTVNRNKHKYDFVSDSQGNVIANVPLQELPVGNNTVTVKLFDNGNNETEKTDSIFVEYDSLRFEKAEKTNDGWKITTNVDDGNHSLNNIDVQTSYLNTNSGNPSWSEIKTPEYTAQKNSDNTIYMDIKSSDIFGSVSNYSFLKIMTKVGDLKYGSAPLYIYAGSEDPNGYFDYILPNTDSSVLVMSDGPTYIHAISTTVDYDECKNWSIDQWETYNHSFGDVYWGGGSVPRNYQIDMDDIHSGESYCVIAYFAKGAPAKSTVMKKQ